MANDEQERHIKPFADFLALQRNGRLAREVAEAFADVNRAVLDTGKSGTLTITLTVKPTGDEVSVMVTDAVKTKVPQHDRGQSIFFVDEDGNPHRSQQSLDDHPVTQPRLTAIPGPGGTVADTQTGEVQ